MTKEDEREVQRKLRILQHAEKIGQVAKTCRYFGIGRASFYNFHRPRGAFKGKTPYEALREKL